MNSKRKHYNPILGALLAGTLVVLAIVLAWPHHIQAQQGPNLLTNPDFEGGWYDISSDSQVPNGWKAHWIDGVTMPGSTVPVFKPELRVLSSNYLPAHEQYFIRSGSHCVKIFKGGAPVYTALSQEVSGLEQGRQYRFIAPVYIDTYEWDAANNRKVAPNDPDGALIRLGAGTVGATWRDENAIAYSSWWGGGYLEYREYTYDFVATAPQMTVYVEFYSKWGVSNSGIFMDDLRLQAMEAVNPPTETPLPPPENTEPNNPNPQPPAATPTPRPDGSIVHIVEEGDTMFGLAIQYGVDLDELRRLNAGTVINDLLSIGQEVIISPGPMANITPTATPEPPPPTDDPANPTVVPTEEIPGGDPTTPPTSGTATLCLLAYFDANQDMFRQADQGEMALPNATITVVGTSGPVGEPYVTDGINEPHCVENLPPGNYVVRHTPPAGYQPTEAGLWNIVLGADQVSSIELGYIRDDTATDPVPTEPRPTESGDENNLNPPDPEVPGEGSNMTKILNTVLMIVGILILLLALGIGALFVLSRRS